MPGPVPILVPSPTNYSAPQVNFDWLGKLPDAYAQGVVGKNQLDRLTAFKGGLPTDAGGNTDWGAAAKKLFALGDYGEANNLVQTGMRMSALQSALQPDPAPPGGAVQPGGGGQSSGVGASLPAAAPSSISKAILGQESGGNPNVGNSVDGARGIGQIMPATFAQYAKPGESIDNPADNLAVHNRIIADYAKRYNGDPARVAVAYFSGPGNVAPAGSPTPWRHDASDGNKKSTSGYVRDVIGRMVGRVPQSGAQQPTASFDSNVTGLPAQSSETGAGAQLVPDPRFAGPGGKISYDTDGHPIPVAGGGAAIPPPGAGPLQHSPYTPQGWGDDQYVQFLQNKSRSLALAGFDKAADIYQKRAQDIGDWQKNNESLRMRFGAPEAGARAGAEAAATLPYKVAQAGQEAAVKLPYDIARTGAEARARVSAENEGKLVETQPVAGGPKVYDTVGNVVRQISSGVPNPGGVPGAGSPVGGPAPSGPVASDPAFIADRQKQIATDENAMTQQYQSRQIARERLQTLSGLLQQYQTGAFADHKADFVAAMRSLGVPVKDTDTANPAAFQAFTKNAIANVFSSAKDLGGRILVSEIQGLTKANANAELQPAAAAKIVGQGLGILDYEDKHTNDYFAWKRQNPNAYDTSGFETGWVKQNPTSQFTSAAEKNVAAKGVPIPTDPTQRPVGQLYITPKGPARWMGNGWKLEAAAP